MLRLFPTLVILALVCLAPEPASALPVFAHRYGLTCQACHTTVPHLNAFGEAFAQNGFRLPELRRRAVLPVAVKVNLAYSSDADPAGLPKAIVDEVELLTGGSLGSRVNYFIEQYAVDGGRPGSLRDAWLQYTSGERHVRAGEFTLPLPVDPETERDTLAHYLIYDQTVGSNTFRFFDDKTGIDAYYGGDDGNSVHAALLTSGAAMLYASKTLGGFTLYGYRYQQGFFRQGFGAQRRAGKLDLAAVLQRGEDGSADSSGGFIEAHYTFSGSLMAVARYDRVRDAIAGAQHQTIFTLVTRPRRNMRFTIEDQIANHHTLSGGWLFAY